MNLSLDKIKLQMARKSLSRKQILAASGLSPSTWHHINKTGRANTTTVGRVAAALGCDVLDIIDSEEVKA